MPTTLSDLKRWFKAGKLLDATHMLVVCDGFDNEDYPVYVKPGENVRERIASFKVENMQRVLEVYSYGKSWEAQSAAGTRVFNLD